MERRLLVTILRVLLASLIPLASPALAAGAKITVVVGTATRNGDSLDYTLQVTNNGPTTIATLTVKCVLLDRRNARIKDDFAVFDNLAPGQTQSGSSFAEATRQQMARFDHLSCSAP